METPSDPEPTAPTSFAFVQHQAPRASVLAPLLADGRAHPKIAVAALGLALALVTACCWGGSAVFFAAPSASHRPVGQVVVAATTTPPPPDTPWPTPTPFPPGLVLYPTPVPGSGTPLPTPDLSQQVIARAVSYGRQVEQSGTDVQQIAATYQDNTRVLVVTVTVGQPITAALEVGEDKLLCFQLQQAYWLHGHWPVQLSEIDLVIQGPVVDAYGNTSTGRYAEADLTATTEALFNWPNLNMDSAWQVYDSVWLAPELTA